MTSWHIPPALSMSTCSGCIRSHDRQKCMDRRIYYISHNTSDRACVWLGITFSQNACHTGFQRKLQEVLALQHQLTMLLLCKTILKYLSSCSGPDLYAVECWGNIFHKLRTIFTRVAAAGFKVVKNMIAFVLLIVCSLSLIGMCPCGRTYGNVKTCLLVFISMLTLYSSACTSSIKANTLAIEPVRMVLHFASCSKLQCCEMFCWGEFHENQFGQCLRLVEGIKKSKAVNIWEGIL